MKRLKPGAAGATRKSPSPRPESPSKDRPPGASAKADESGGGAAALNQSAGGDAVTADAAAQQFLAELAAHWREHGKDAFDAALTKDPVRYMNLAAQLLAGGAERGRGDLLIALLAGFEQSD